MVSYGQCRAHGKGKSVLTAECWREHCCFPHSIFQHSRGVEGQNGLCLGGASGRKAPQNTSTNVGVVREDTEEEEVEELSRVPRHGPNGTSQRGQVQLVQVGTLCCFFLTGGGRCVHSTLFCIERRWVKRL